MILNKAENYDSNKVLECFDPLAVLHLKNFIPFLTALMRLQKKQHTNMTVILLKAVEK